MRTRRECQGVYAKSLRRYGAHPQRDDSAEVSLIQLLRDAGIVTSSTTFGGYLLEHVQWIGQQRSTRGNWLVIRHAGVAQGSVAAMWCSLSSFRLTIGVALKFQELCLAHLPI